MERWCPDDIGRDSWDWVGPLAWERACFNSPEWGGGSSPVEMEPPQIVLLLLLLWCVVVCFVVCVCVVCVVCAVCCVVLGFVLCCSCMLTWRLPECFVLNTREFRQRCLGLNLIWSARLFALTRGLDCHKGLGSYVHFCPCPCSSTCRWSRLAIHRHWGPLCVYPVLLCPLWPCNHRMFCHRQRDWAVSIRSYMQQDMDISQAPPHLGAPFALSEHRSRLKTTIQKTGDDVPETQMSLVNSPMRVFRPAGRHVCRITHTYTTCCCCSSKIIL